MKRNKILLTGFIVVAIASAGILVAADHIDAPAVTNQPTDITDLYVFRGQDPNNLVFVANTQGLLSPGMTAAAKFDANTLIEFNIDVNNDNREDLVIQAIYDAGSNRMKVYGPIAPSEVGTRSKIEGNLTVEAGITPYGSAPVIGTSSNGIRAFAGPRDDPFFFDLTAYQRIIAGQATSFPNPGVDAFKGTNVLSIVIEVPKSLLGTVTSNNANVWVESKKKI